MPKARTAYYTPEWRKPVCIGTYDETCETNLQEGCQFMGECKKRTLGTPEYFAETKRISAYSDSHVAVIENGRVVIKKKVSVGGKGTQ